MRTDNGVAYSAESQSAFRQVVKIVEATTGCRMVQIHSNTCRGEREDGVPFAEVRLTGGEVQVTVGLLIADRNSRAPILDVCEEVRKLDRRVEIVVSFDKNTVGVQMRVDAEHMTFAREDVLGKQIELVCEAARTLQALVPTPIGPAEHEAAYKLVVEVLDPIRRLPDAIKPTDKELEWALEIAAMTDANVSIGVSHSDELSGIYAMRLLAGAMEEQSGTLGRCKIPALNPKMLPELVNKAPGIVTLQARIVALGGNVYELCDEMGNVLSALSNAGRSVVVTGTYESLQSLFHGGQGSVVDPLRPYHVRAPRVDRDKAIRFAVEVASEAQGGISPADRQEVIDALTVSFDSRSATDVRKHGLALAHREIRVRARTTGRAPCVALGDRLMDASETFAGLSRRTASTDLGIRPFPALADCGELYDRLQSEVFGQEKAITEFCDRLGAEYDTRPPHQPIRICAQGTPGTGKSQSMSILADVLDVPFVNIDAASMPDSHTAASQLLGSGRGIVGSYQAGRLEEAAKTPSGAVVEISDLDHATPQVRASLADLFLQALDRGFAQSAKGSPFSCRNLILGFTINLPGGMDAEVRKGLGFGGAPDEKEVKSRVATEITKAFSSAFLSRIGVPILYETLSEETLHRVIEQEMERALICAVDRQERKIRSVTVVSGVGRSILDSYTDRTAYGARGALERARIIVSKGLRSLPGDVSGADLRIEPDDEEIVRIIQE